MELAIITCLDEKNRTYSVALFFDSIIFFAEIPGQSGCYLEIAGGTVLRTVETFEEILLSFDPKNKKQFLKSKQSGQSGAPAEQMPSAKVIQLPQKLRLVTKEETN